MKQSCFVYLFILAISTPIIGSERDLSSGTPLQQLDLPNTAFPINNLNNSPEHTESQHQSSLDRIAAACHEDIKAVEQYEHLTSTTQETLDNIRAQRVRSFLNVAQKNHDEKNPSMFLIPTAAATVAAGAASTITYIAKKSTQRVPVRGLADLTLDSVTGGLSTYITMGVVGGITLITVGAGTAAIVSTKRAISKTWNQMRQTKQEGELAERHSRETTANLQVQISTLSAFTAEGRKQQSANMLQLVEENKRMSTTQDRILKGLESTKADNEKIITGLRTLEDAIQQKDGRDSCIKMIASIKAEVDAMKEAIKGKKDKRPR